MPSQISEDVVGPVEPQSINTLCLKSLKRTHDMFVSNHGMKFYDDLESQRLKLMAKIVGEYEPVKDLPPPAGPGGAASSAVTVPAGQIPAFVHPTQAAQNGPGGAAGASKLDGKGIAGVHAYPNAPGVQLTSNTAVESAPSESSIDKLIQSLPTSKPAAEAARVSSSLAVIKQTAGLPERYRPPGMTNAAQTLIRKTKAMIKPEWHPPWKLMRVISGHLGWVRSIAVDVSNEWFVTGAADRTIKIWDLASGTLKLTLTGHINTIRGLAVDARHPYLFSVGEDKTVKCWDLEYNKVIRQYHGHLSGVYSVALHPTIDVFISGGRDSTARVWDMRTKQAVHVLAGHSNTVVDVKAQAVDPQIVTSSMDTTIKLWDLTAGKCATTLTNHKKSVRALVLHPSEFSFASASADNIKKWKFPDGTFLANLAGHRTILNTLACNSDGVLVSGGDNGSLNFWDWKTGYNFSTLESTPQPGSLDSEAGIFAAAFDNTGARLITGEADKTIKIWREDDNATPETHPIDMKAFQSMQQKRY